MKGTSHSGQSLDRFAKSLRLPPPRPLMRLEVSSGVGSSATLQTPVSAAPPGHIFVLPHKTRRTREMEANMELMLPVVLWVINSIVSDPGVSGLLSASGNCGRLNYYPIGPRTLPSPWWPISYKSEEFKMLSHLPPFFSFFSQPRELHTALNQCLVMAPWER